MTNRYYNGTLKRAAQALRYLAENQRPIGGEDFPNSISCHQLADELEELEEFRLNDELFNCILHGKKST